MYVDVSVVGFTGAENRRFSYAIPTDNQVEVGSFVEIKFGKKASLGIVRELNTKRPQRGINVLPIISVLPHKPLPKHLLDLSDWMIEYYVAPASSVWQSVLPKNPNSTPRKKFTEKNTKTQPLVKLSQKQQGALDNITKSAKPVLLEGAMGSGKTEIYFHLIKQVLDKNKSAILLMPEIFLTNQMIERARKHFGNKLLITHSGLTPAQRRAVWDSCNSQDSVLVLGPRSALFSPLHNLGLVIIDECHEPSYKQDSSPRYLSEHVAGMLAKLTNSKLVLGSATPSITTRYLADAGKLLRVALPERAISSAHPNIVMVDQSKSRDVFSEHLLTMLKENIHNKKLSLLYVNRRGTAPVYMCQDCGHSFECPSCGTNLHFHADTMRLQCHICSYQISPPANCPQCNGTNLRGVGVGTKAVVEQIHELMPEAKIARIDRDSSNANHIQEILSKMNANELDILVGTQMIGRGIDIASLQLVGIINADYDLMIMDYNSRERAFQLLTQTAGRAGRREIQGEVVIQSSNTENDFFTHIINNDYEGFYQSELNLRKKYSYPPFSYLLKLECGFVNPKLGKSKCEQLAKGLSKLSDISTLGPVSSYPAIRAHKHMWQIVIKCKNRGRLVEIAKSLDPFWIINLDPFGIL